MNNNQNNPQEVPQVKSGREKAIVSVNQTKYLFGSGRTAYIDGFECGYNQRIEVLERRNGHLQEYKDKERERRSNFALRIAELENDLNESNDMYDKDIKLLRGKISELEALNCKYREALEVIVDHKGDTLGWREIGMNSVDIAEQALNSKEVGP